MKYGCVSKLEIHKNPSFSVRFRGPEFGSNLNPPRLHRTVNKHSNSLLATESFLVRRAIHLHFMVNFSMITMITMIAMVEFPAKKFMILVYQNSCINLVPNQWANGNFDQYLLSDETRKFHTTAAYQNQICSKEADVLQLFEGCLDAALLLARPRFGVGGSGCESVMPIRIKVRGTAWWERDTYIFYICTIDIDGYSRYTDGTHTHTNVCVHTHTHTHIYIYICIYTHIYFYTAKMSCISHLISQFWEPSAVSQRAEPFFLTWER